MQSFLAILIVIFLFSCASGDKSRHFTIPFKIGHGELFFRQLQDSIPQYGFILNRIEQDTLTASTYVKQGALNERAIKITMMKNETEGTCSIVVNTITYFRQDTIIEYYDEHHGFPASYRKDFGAIIQCAQRIGKRTFKSKK